MKFNPTQVVDVAVGSMHCLAVTEDGEVWCWGRNDQGQLADSNTSSKADPSLVTLLEGQHISGVACGPAQVRSQLQQTESAILLQELSLFPYMETIHIWKPGSFELFTRTEELK